MPSQNLNQVHLDWCLKSLSTVIAGFRAPDCILHGMILENISLARCCYNWAFHCPRNRIALHDVAAEESVHLTIAVQAFWSAGLASLRVDENFVGHRVKQVHELLLLKLDDFDSHEEIGFGLVICIDDRLEDKVHHNGHKNRLLNSKFIILDHFRALHVRMYDEDHLPHDQMWHVID